MPYFRLLAALIFVVSPLIAPGLGWFEAVSRAWH